MSNVYKAMKFSIREKELFNKSGKWRIKQETKKNYF